MAYLNTCTRCGVLYIPPGPLADLPGSLCVTCVSALKTGIQIAHIIERCLLPDYLPLLQKELATNQSWHDFEGETTLSDFSCDRLKDLCRGRGLGLDDSGREKTALVERLDGTTAAATGNGNTSAAPVGRTSRKQAQATPPVTGKLMNRRLRIYA